MKRSFERIVSGLLAAAMLTALPVVSMADRYVKVGDTVESGNNTYEAECDHTTIAMNGTLLKNEGVESTCTELGYQVYECNNCGTKVYVGDDVAMVGHVWSLYDIEKDEYTGERDITFICERCGARYSYHDPDADNITEPTRHPHSNVQHETYLETCGEPGYVVTTCQYEGCDYEQVQAMAPLADAHKWSDWTVYEKPKDNAKGYAYRTCKVCGYEEWTMLKQLTTSATKKIGRVNTELAEVYITPSAYDDGKLAGLVGKGATLEIGELVNGYYEVLNGVIDPYGGNNLSSSNQILYIDADYVDRVSANADKVYSDYKGLQKVATITASDGQVVVRSGPISTSQQLGSLKKGEDIYVWRVEGNWGRISETENAWVLLDSSCMDIVNVYCCGTDLPDLKDADQLIGKDKEIDTLTLLVDKAALRDLKGNFIGWIAKRDANEKKIQIKLYQSLESDKPYKRDDNGKVVQVFVEGQALKDVGYTDAIYSNGGWFDVRDVSLKSGLDGNTPVETNPEPTSKIVATGIVTSSINLNVRREPEVSVLNLMGSLPTGTKLEFLKVKDGWGKIDYNGEEGWVSMAYVQLTSSTSSSGTTTAPAVQNATVANCSKGVNVRDTTDAQGKLLGTIPVGTRVAITKLENGWGFVEGRGWVYLQYIQLDAGAEEAIKNPKKNDTPVDEEDDTYIKTYTNVEVVGTVLKPVTVYKNAIAKVGTELCELTVDQEFTIVDRTIANSTQWFKVKTMGITGWLPATVGAHISLNEISGIVNVSSLNVYAGASLDSRVVDKLVVNTEVTIAKDGQTTDGIYVWGKLKGMDGYVQMNYLTLKKVVNSGTEGYSVGDVAITGEINDDATVYGKSNRTLPMVTLKKNQKVSITHWYDSGTEVMGKITIDGKVGWIQMSKINQNAVTATVKVDVVNFYQTAGNLATKSTHVLRKNEKITVYERKLVGGTAWGRVQVNSEANNLWMNLAGTSLGAYSLVPEQNTTNNGGNTNGSNNGTTGGTTNGTTGGNTGTTTPTTPVTYQTGVITGAEEVNVRSGAGVSNAKVTALKKGTVVKVYEQKAVDGAQWGRIDQGWVAMSYVDTTSLGSAVTTPGGTVSGSTILTSVPTGAIGVGFVNTDNLKVRAGAGLGYAVTTTLPKYTNVVIYESFLSEGMAWARCDQGWVCGSYLTYTGLSTSGSGTDGSVARCFYTARVRATAGVAGAVMGNVMVNSRLKIYETTQYSGETWGRTSLGWISMNYVLTGDVPLVP